MALALSSLVVIVTVRLLVKWFNGRIPEPNDKPDNILASISDAARRLRAGEDARTVVLFCYQEMIRILGAAGRINATCLTPREFEYRLRELGLSDVSSVELTRLFEVVRYAGRIDGDFAARSLMCLDTIQAAHSYQDS